MRRPLLEVADLIRAAGADFIERNRSWIRFSHVNVMLVVNQVSAQARVPPGPDRNVLKGDRAAKRLRILLREEMHVALTVAEKLFG